MNAKEKSTHSKSVEKMNTHLILVKKEAVCAHNPQFFIASLKNRRTFASSKGTKSLRQDNNTLINR